MTTSIIILCLWAALLELDTTYAFQTLISRPIIAAPLLSLCTGDLMAGLQVGIFAELLFTDATPLGGIIPPNGVVASAIPLILYSQGIELYFSFFLGVICAQGYSFLDAFLRKTRFKWLAGLEQKVTRRPSYISQIIISSLAFSFLVTFIFLSTLAWICTKLMFILYPYLTARIHFAFQLAYIAVPWIGLATLIPTFRLKAR